MKKASLLLTSTLAMAFMLSACTSEKWGFKAYKPVFDPKLVISGKGDGKDKKKDDANAGNVSISGGQTIPEVTPTPTPDAPETPEGEGAPAPEETPADPTGDNTTTPAPGETDTNGLTEEDRLVGHEALDVFTAQMINGDVSLDDMAAAIKTFDPEMAKIVFGLRVIKTLKSEALPASGDIPAVNATYGLAIDTAIRFIDAETQEQKVFQLTATMEVQNGSVVEAVPADAMALNEEADAAATDETAVQGGRDAVKFYATCADVECAQVLLLVKTFSADSNGNLTIEKNVAFRLEEDSTGSTNGKMFLIASSAGANNIKDLDSEEVQNVLLTAGIIIEQPATEEEAATEEESNVTTDLGQMPTKEELEAFRTGP